MPLVAQIPGGKRVRSGRHGRQVELDASVGERAGRQHGWALLQLDCAGGGDASLAGDQGFEDQGAALERRVGGRGKDDPSLDLGGCRDAGAGEGYWTQSTSTRAHIGGTRVRADIGGCEGYLVGATGPGGQRSGATVGWTVELILADAGVGDQDGLGRRRGSNELRVEGDLACAADDAYRCTVPFAPNAGGVDVAEGIDGYSPNLGECRLSGRTAIA